MNNHSDRTSQKPLLRDKATGRFLPHVKRTTGGLKGTEKTSMSSSRTQGKSSPVTNFGDSKAVKSKKQAQNQPHQTQKTQKRALTSDSSPAKESSQKKKLTNSTSRSSPSSRTTERTSTRRSS